MGNSPSSSGEAPAAGAGAHTAGTEGVQQHEGRTRSVYNPFRATRSRENYPDLDETLRFDPDAAPDSGPSIDTLSRLYPVDFLPRMPSTSTNPEENEAAQVAMDAWFRERAAQKGGSPNPSLVWTMPGIPYVDSRVPSVVGSARTSNGGLLQHATSSQAAPDPSSSGYAGNLLQVSGHQFDKAWGLSGALQSADLPNEQRGPSSGQADLATLVLPMSNQASSLSSARITPLAPSILHALQLQAGGPGHGSGHAAGSRYAATHSISQPGSVVSSQRPSHNGSTATGSMLPVSHRTSTGAAAGPGVWIASASDAQLPGPSRAVTWHSQGDAGGGDASGGSLGPETGTASPGPRIIRGVKHGFGSVVAYEGGRSEEKGAGQAMGEEELQDEGSGEEQLVCADVGSGGGSDRDTGPLEQHMTVAALPDRPSTQAGLGALQGPDAGPEAGHDQPLTSNLGVAGLVQPPESASQPVVQASLMQASQRMGSEQLDPRVVQAQPSAVTAAQTLQASHVHGPYDAFHASADPALQAVLASSPASSPERRAAGTQQQPLPGSPAPGWQAAAGQPPPLMLAPPGMLQGWPPGMVVLAHPTLGLQPLQVMQGGQLAASQDPVGGVWVAPAGGGRMELLTHFAPPDTDVIEMASPTGVGRTSSYMQLRPSGSGMAGAPPRPLPSQAFTAAASDGPGPSRSDSPDKVGGEAAPVSFMVSHAAMASRAHSMPAPVLGQSMQGPPGSLPSLGQHSIPGAAAAGQASIQGQPGSYAVYAGQHMGHSLYILQPSDVSTVDVDEYWGATTTRIGASGFGSARHSPVRTAVGAGTGPTVTGDPSAGGASPSAPHQSPQSAQLLRTGMKRVWSEAQGIARPMLVPMPQMWPSHMYHPAQQQQQAVMQWSQQHPVQPQPQQSPPSPQTEKPAAQSQQPASLPAPQQQRPGQLIEVGLLRDLLQQCTQMVAVAAATATATALAAMASPRSQRQRIRDPTDSPSNSMPPGLGSPASPEPAQTQQAEPAQTAVIAQPPTSPQHTAFGAHKHGSEIAGRATDCRSAPSAGAGGSGAELEAMDVDGSVPNLPDFLAAPDSQMHLRLDALPEDEEEEPTPPVTLSDVEQGQGLLHALRVMTAVSRHELRHMGTQTASPPKDATTQTPPRKSGEQVAALERSIAHERTRVSAALDLLAHTLAEQHGKRARDQSPPSAGSDVLLGTLTAMRSPTRARVASPGGGVAPVLTAATALPPFVSLVSRPEPQVPDIGLAPLAAYAQPVHEMGKTAVANHAHPPVQLGTVQVQPQQQGVVGSKWLGEQLVGRALNDMTEHARKSMEAVPAVGQPAGVAATGTSVARRLDLASHEGRPQAAAAAGQQVPQQEEVNADAAGVAALPMPAKATGLEPPLVYSSFSPAAFRTVLNWGRAPPSAPPTETYAPAGGRPHASTGSSGGDGQGSTRMHSLGMELQGLGVTGAVDTLNIPGAGIWARGLAAAATPASTLPRSSYAFMGGGSSSGGALELPAAGAQSQLQAPRATVGQGAPALRQLQPPGPWPQQPPPARSPAFSNPGLAAGLPALMARFAPPSYGLRASASSTQVPVAGAAAAAPTAAAAPPQVWQDQAQVPTAAGRVATGMGAGSAGARSVAMPMWERSGAVSPPPAAKRARQVGFTDVSSALSGVGADLMASAMQELHAGLPHTDGTGLTGGGGLAGGAYSGAGSGWMEGPSVPYRSTSVGQDQALLQLQLSKYVGPVESGVIRAAKAIGANTRLSNFAPPTVLSNLTNLLAPHGGVSAVAGQVASNGSSGGVKRMGGGKGAVIMPPSFVPQGLLPPSMQPAVHVSYTGTGGLPVPGIPQGTAQHSTHTFEAHPGASAGMRGMGGAGPMGGWAGMPAGSLDVGASSSAVPLMKPAAAQPTGSMGSVVQQSWVPAPRSEMLQRYLAAGELEET